MTCWLAIPIKAPEDCKSRLRPALSDEARRTLVASMLRHVVDISERASGVDKVLIVGPSRHDLPARIEQIADPGEGLNAALEAAKQAALHANVERLIIVAADLPLLTVADIDALVRLAPERAAIAPDRAGAGTNALSLPLPRARDFAFRFGPRSAPRHSAEAARLGLALETIRSETLAFDVDEPQDLAALRRERT